ncbi:cytochrome P450 [Amylostereum chailletii]|nr:cytochrome P450 [Amylostereum chailletii]
MPSVVAICGIGLVLFSSLFRRCSGRRQHHLPPGPKGLPIIGNVAQLLDRKWLMERCKHEYGDLVYLNVLGQSTIVINSQKIASDLLDKKSSIYSSRPRLVVARDILCGGMLFPFSPHTDQWRRMRRGAHEGFKKSVSDTFHEIQTKEAVILTLELMADPSARDQHFARFSTSLVMSVTYDYPSLGSGEDKNIIQIEAFISRLKAASAPGAHLADILPWMTKIPSRLAKWKRDAEEWHQRYTEMFEDLLGAVRVKLENGIDRPSLSATLIKEQQRLSLSTTEAAWLAGTMYAAGTETTTSVLAWWTLAMVVYPETQKRAQAEIEEVVGRARPPNFTDLPHLQYVRAMVKEVLRWRQPLPLGIPHATTEDDWYKGMFIPKGSTVFPNLRPCNLDPSVYGDDADKFNPERFLDRKGNSQARSAETKEDGHSAYGFGRRLCVGRHVANDSLFIAFATILWAVNIDSARDEVGNPIHVDVDGYEDTGLVHRPVPFACTVTPRFPDAQSLLEHEHELRVR